MKALTSLTLLALAAAVGCQPHAEEAGSATPPVAATPAQAPAAEPAPTAEPPAASPDAAPTAVRIATPALIPADLPAPVQEVIRLAQSSVGEGVVKSYAENLEGGFELDADQIIYLADVGVPDPVIQVLIAKSAVRPNNTAPAPAAAAVVAPPTPTASLVPTEAPPPVYGQPQAGPPPQQPPPAPAQATAAVPAAPVQNVTYNVFYDSLSPYGSWVDVAGYGRCWRPTVAVINTGWRPYCDDGWWVWSDYGWYWHSTYSWGWAPFHYGRWCQTPGFGWVWSPGNVWGPAWVAWRYTDRHCGWAPLPPQCGWTASVGFSWTSGGTSVGVGFGIGTDWWITTGWSSFSHRRLRSVCLPPRDGHRALADSRITVGSGNVVNIVGDNNTVVINDGVPHTLAQRRTRSEIPKVAVTDAPTPGAGGARLQPAPGRSRPEIAVYRPTLNREARPAVSPNRAASGLVPSRGGTVPTARPAVAGSPTSAVKSAEPVRRPATTRPDSNIGPAPAPNRTFAHEDPPRRPAVTSRPAVPASQVPGRLEPAATAPRSPGPTIIRPQGTTRSEVPTRTAPSLRTAPGSDVGRVNVGTISPGTRQELPKPVTAFPAVRQPSGGGYGTSDSLRSGSPSAGTPAGTVNRPGSYGTFGNPGGAPARPSPGYNAPSARPQAPASGNRLSPGRTFQAPPTSRPAPSPAPAAQPTIRPSGGGITAAPAARPTTRSPQAPARERR